MSFREHVQTFVESLSAGRAGEYRMWRHGEVTLYSSCFAAMTMRTLGTLDALDADTKRQWGGYLSSWQEQGSGYFVGPELVGPEALTSGLHDREHLRMHLTAHVLPALHALGATPAHSLAFAHRFLDQKELRAWLDARDLSNAWFEGNNLLFMGQFLVHLRDAEGRPEAGTALDLYFEWLDAHQDPGTGLWGTNQGCDDYTALYGAYHQLILYYFCERDVPHAKRIIDTVLRLQHQNGSFTRYGEGGTCEDIDGLDVIINLHRRTGYRPRAVRYAVRKGFENMRRHQVESGGFVYRHGKPFTHMGMSASRTPAGEAELFSTWFRSHAIAAAGLLLNHDTLGEESWGFNDVCSMGWHDPCVQVSEQPDPWRDRLPFPWHWVELTLRKIRRSCGPVLKSGTSP